MLNTVPIKIRNFDCEIKPQLYHPHFKRGDHVYDCFGIKGFILCYFESGLFAVAYTDIDEVRYLYPEELKSPKEHWLDIVQGWVSYD